VEAVKERIASFGSLSQVHHVKGWLVGGWYERLIIK
jgi:hypothetical protein